MKIEKGIPIPERRQGTSSKYPIAKMVVGDSIVVENRSQSLYVWRLSKLLGITITTRELDNGTVRVWRTA